jgi:hypothetical protein
MLVLALHIGSINSPTKDWASPTLKKWVAELPSSFSVPSEASDAEWEVLEPSYLACDRLNEESTSRNLRWLARQLKTQRRGSPIEVVNGVIAAEAEACAGVALPQNEAQLTLSLLAVKTRAFAISGAFLPACLVPTGDLLNHAARFNVDYLFSKGQDFAMKARKDIGSGHELLDSYGDKDAWEMLKG